jgi:hypothetical protein
MNLLRFDYQYRNLIRFPVPAGSSLAMIMILNTVLLLLFLMSPANAMPMGEFLVMT